MSAVTFRCPNCAQVLQMDDRYQGAQVRCPKCKGLMIVPSVSAPAARPSSPAAPLDPSEPVLDRAAPTTVVDANVDKAVESSCAALKGSDVSGRCAAVKTLGTFRDSRAVDALCAALRDPSYDVRAGAATALRGLKAPSAAVALREALKDDHLSVRRAAAMSLAELGPPQGLWGLVWLLGLRDHPDATETEKSGSARAEAQILRAQAAAVEPLQAALKDLPFTQIVTREGVAGRPGCA
ncbi:MAG: hypothetical protein FJ272_14830 [Planctomycetes bacterium]|nr:hypothetical protein [Planctomycetota bacterium]